MIEFRPCQGALILMLLILYCKANNIPQNKVNTSQELGKSRSEIHNGQATTNRYDEVDGTSTVCPEDLKKQLETSTEILNINLENKDEKLQTLPKTLLSHESEVRFENDLETNQEDEDLDIKQLTTQNAEDTTTICPEELLKQTQNIKNLSNSNTNVNYPEEITTVSSEELPQEEDRFQNQVETNSNDNNLEALLGNVNDVTTICPEELIKNQEAKRKGNGVSVKSLLKVQKDSALLMLINIKQESSAVEKEFQINDAFQQNTNGGNVRSKRQVSDYSPPYIRQPGYNSQGLALTSRESLNENNQNYNIKSPQSAGSASYQNNQQSRVSNNQPNYSKRVPANYNIKTYQQIQRQYQSLYPKTYQNYAKPVKSYLNPSSNVRYPSNGNFKNYYKLNSGVNNRRQFQASARPKSTTIRSTRTTIKKKFRPSPVFA